MAYMGHMDPDVRCPKKAIKLNQSINHLLMLNIFEEK